ncbi:hypothetical protein BDZ91DRAFT_781958 [Kalaharituber pfeilii]|nr:hypothetical protein BDZ91DRAFT_781958 [Kalaharituber pfeilii]
MPQSRHSTTAQKTYQSASQSTASQGPTLVLTLWIHDNLLSKHEAWLNYELFPPGTCKPGDLVEVRPANSSGRSSLSVGEGSSAEAHGDSGDDEGTGGEGIDKRGTSMRRSKSGSIAPSMKEGSDKQRFLFVVRPMDPELRQKQPKMQVSLAAPVATLFGFQSRSPVTVTVVQKELHEASHIEISFRDQHIGRSDMWRLASNELCDTCVYKGKKILFVGSIKAQVRSIYVRGQKVQAAYFSSRTRPIFRSESSRYAIFIQMSREMWHFDTEGSGEVVFNKLINGFLPELFKRWRKINAHHLVNIVLFTRVVYDQGSIVGIPSEKELDGVCRDGTSYKDFFRVVVSNMASTDWTIILHQLKKEFSVFLRDVLIQPVPDTPPGTPQAAPEALSAQVSPTTVDAPIHAEKTQSKSRPTHIIAGQPSDAIHGNVLEAINLATSQFSRDFIDRDLVRTGISVVIITPGTGHFEVDYENLRMTTENLVSNGIGIDLVCLAKMPLHSVPLFKYKNPKVISSHASGVGDGKAEERITSPPVSAGPYGSSLGRAGMSPPKATASHSSSVEAGEWIYAIPHWIDISFWSSSQQSNSSSRQQKSSENRARTRQFIARCKMYELQMMGIMENEISSISIPFLHESPFYAPYDPQPKSRTQQFATMHSHQSNASASLREKEKKDEASTFSWMDDYDDMVFRPLSEVQERIEKIKRRRVREEQERYKEMATLSAGALGPPFAPEKERDRYSHAGPSGSVAEKRMRERKTSTESRKDVSTAIPPLLSSDTSAAPPAAAPPSFAFGNSFSALKPGRLARQISFGFRGFGGGGTPKAVASTGLSTANAPGPILTRGFNPVPEAEIPKVLQQERPRTPVRPVTPNHPIHNANPAKIASTESSDSSSTHDVPKNRSSRPISIKNAMTPAPNAIMALERTQERRKPSYTSPIEPHKDRTQIDILKAASMSRLSGPRLDMVGSNVSAPAALSPTSALAPWFSLLNPCNPKKDSTNLLNVYRRWQHVFPRPLRTASVKWKSLCSPAALPLTTEHFPTAEQLSTEYQQNPYTISGNEEDGDLVRNREELVREMISQRLEQGFQIVVGNAVADVTGNHGGDNNIFDKGYMTKGGSSVFMSMGSQIHQLICDAEYNVEVKRYVRKPTVPVSGSQGNNSFSKYSPYIKTVLADEYIPKTIDFRNGNQDYNWNYVDHFIGGYESNFSEQLRFCRSRFLLIPTDPPPSARRHNHPHAMGYSEDSDEEIRLEGIKKLTQLFQRNRHIPPEDRNFERLSKRKDPNPLEILYKTFDPSVVVAQQLESLPLTENDASTRRNQLFVGSEMFDRSNLNLKTLAQEIQGPKGVRLQNRIWHIRLHQKCFIGSELVTWMMENFRDLESRAEAVELGNELMRSGLFHHVEGRHMFRDGNYFYQISNEYAIARPSSKGGWFGNRSKPAERSATIPGMPSTPGLNEAASPGHSRSRSSTVVMDEPTEYTGPKRTIQLSKAMKYDVDPTKKSYRPEIITLHYDRLHNPDNCYHIRIDWMNVTCKLIEDAISSWARTADRYGLSLVEAPIDEISSIPLTNPLRAPSVLKPVISPPPMNSFGLLSSNPTMDMSASFSAALAKPDPLYYHKAILKKHGFVLDMEAAKNFPSDVEVVYSWGRITTIVFAQITDEGQFLLMANRLYTQRAGAQNKYERQGSEGYDAGSRTLGSSGNFSIGVGYGIGGCNAQGQGPSTFPPPSFLSPPAALAGGGGSYITPELVKEDLERFCLDEDELLKFYDEVDRRANLNMPVNMAALNTGPTPSMSSVSGFGGVMSLAQAQLGLRTYSEPVLGFQGGLQQYSPGGAYCVERTGSATGERERERDRESQKGADRERGRWTGSVPPTPLLGPLGGSRDQATTAASSVTANGRNSSRSGRSSIIEAVVEMGEAL